MRRRRILFRGEAKEGGRFATQKKKERMHNQDNNVPFTLADLEAPQFGF